MHFFLIKLLSGLVLLNALGWGWAGQHVSAAEKEATVLTITGDLIGEIESLDAATGPTRIIARYYALLPEPVKTEARSLHRELAALIPDYEVASAAADTAELNNVMSDLAFLWASIRSIHAREFTPDVVAILRAAYIETYSLLGDPAPR